MVNVASDGVANTPTKYGSIEHETRTVVDTATAAHLLLRKVGTLHKWSNLGNGPIKPVRINGKLGWRIDEIRRLLNGGAQ